MSYKIVYTKNAQKDIPFIKSAKLDNKVKMIIDIIRANPFQNPPSYEKLLGNLEGLYSRRINIKHRLVYSVDENLKIVKIVSMWTHYEY